MKKLSGLVMAMVFVFVLAACGAEKTTGDGQGGSDTEKKSVRVVTDANYAPFEYMDGGKIVGFDVDFVNAVAKEAGYDVKIENVGWDPLFLEVKNKSADMGMSAITINDERKQTYDFSVPYFLSTNKILVPEGSDIKSAEDLKGKTVSVQNATTGQSSAEKLLGKNSKDIKKFKNNNLAILELTKGGADAVVADNTVIEEYAKNNPKQKLVVIEDSKAFEAEFYGLMLPKGSNVKADFDEATKKIIDNGKYTEIYKKWFKVEPDLDKLKEQQ
ncbi:basic amino acid ABC transporter substrate-binding protein [Peribacillus cavernae]|uniref:Basic amino acid ABC transporter substrate-binding protein n=1 Tax=Peribacillus cavernae TaxID=1674310 RepID=A0A3S0VB85_9BACI|nr:basic amino acid ABC transporter substrate-binding protein [Peribacillus cavernae]MDQ0219168.1 polar amino acid transport system substrate-binding protein [Peribacillus cavernae]RUQ28605.1 basic amino acid ABC transporter substrate-binding protein [Peribacillus cavernae]